MGSKAGRNVQLETLKAIERCEGKSSSEIANELGIKPSTFSQRTKGLKEQCLVECKKTQKNSLYFLTDSGKKRLTKLKTDDKSMAAELTESLGYLLQMSFDGAYCFMDSYFHKPLFSVIDDSMRNIPEINPRSSFIMGLCQKLSDFICMASLADYTKETFAHTLLSEKHYSKETKGFVYYIADKYETYKQNNHKQAMVVLFALWKQ